RAVGDAGYRLPPVRGGGARPDGRRVRAEADAAGHDALRQAAGDVVRARARRDVARRGSDGRRRGCRGAPRDDADQGGCYRVSRSRKSYATNGHGTRRGPERAVLAAVRLPKQRRWEVEE